MIFNYNYGGQRIIKVTIQGAPNESVTLTPKRTSLKTINVQLDTQGDWTGQIIADEYTLEGSFSKKALSSVKYKLSDQGVYNMWNNKDILYWFGREGNYGPWVMYEFEPPYGYDYEPPYYRDETYGLMTDVVSSIGSTCKRLEQNVYDYRVNGSSNLTKPGQASFYFNKPLDNTKKLHFLHGEAIRREGKSGTSQTSANTVAGLPIVSYQIGWGTISDFLTYDMTIPGTQLTTDKNWRCYVSADNISVKNLEGYDTYKPEKFAVRTLGFSNAADVYAGAKLSVKNVLGGPEDKRAAMFIHAIWLE